MIYIVIAIDYFTKFIEAWALDACTAIKTARFLFDEIVCRYGMMDKLLSDQGRNFEAALIAELCKLLGVKNDGISPPM